MSKRSKKLTYERKLSEGRGVGRGKEYKPWITIQDFPSNGRVSRIKGLKTQRQHEFLSDLERNYFYYLEASINVIDIREQFPLLPLEETLLIAKEIGIKHPIDPQTKEPIVMTTDFLITIKTEEGEVKELARTLKYKDELLEKRIVEKFELERLYFENRGINWGIVTNEEIDKQLAQNLADTHAYYDLAEIEAFATMKPWEVQELIDVFLECCVTYKDSLRSMCIQFDKAMSLEKGSGITLFKHLLWAKLIAIDLTKAINWSEHIDISINDKGLSKGAEIG